MNRIQTGLGALVVVLLVFAAFVYLSKHPTSQSADLKTAGSQDHLLTLSGSNSIGGELGPALVKAWLEQVKKAQDVQIRQPDTAQPVFEVAGRLNGKDVKVLVRARGTATGFEEAKSGGVDVIMASRPIKPAEVKALSRLGAFGGPDAEHVIADDGIAMIVAPGNPVRSLSVEQLHDIFTCAVKDWGKVGGAAGTPIHLYARDDNSGTYDGFKAKVLNGDPLCAAKRYDDSAKLERDVARDPNGIGFVAMPYVKTTTALAVSSGEADPFAPTTFTVRTERYPLSRRLYLYAPPAGASQDTADFIHFAESDAGQAVVKSLGFVDLALTLTLDTVPQGPTGIGNHCKLSGRWPGNPMDYCNILARGGIQKVIFKFATGHDALDSLAAADLRRLLRLLESESVGSIVLVGHADSSGAYASNCRLSRERAQSVQKALKTLGIANTKVAGFCDEIPARSNDTDDGRANNRRVEVFFQ